MRALARHGGSIPLPFTIDTFLGHKPWKDFADNAKKQRPIAPKTLKTAPRIILEEIGQWSNASFELLDMALRRITGNAAAFGGFQIVACGDFSQLPPPNRDRVDSGRLWKELAPQRLELTVQFRVLGDGSEDFNLFLRQVRHAIDKREPLPPFAAGLLDYHLRRPPPRGEFLGVTLTKKESRRCNWDRVDRAEERYVIGDSRVFPAKYPESDDAVPLCPGCPVQMTWNVWKNNKLE